MIKKSKVKSVISQRELDNLRAEESKQIKEQRKVLAICAISLIIAVYGFYFSFRYFYPVIPRVCMSGGVINDSVQLTGRLAKYNGKINQICFDTEKEN